MVSVYTFALKEHDRISNPIQSNESDISDRNRISARNFETKHGGKTAAPPRSKTVPLAGSRRLQSMRLAVINAVNANNVTILCL